MAKLVQNEGKAFIELSIEEFQKIKSENAEFEIAKAKEGLFILIEKNGIGKSETGKNNPVQSEIGKNPAEKADEPDKTAEILENAKALEKENAKFFEIDAKILGLLKVKGLSERVEGNFEKLLNKEELERLKELVKEGKVIPFKLNESYKKAVYKLPEPKRKESESIEAKDKAIEEYSMENDGFLIVKNEERAKRISQDFSEKIKAGEIKGIKSFDGNYYIIENSLIEKYRGRVIKEAKEKKSISLNEISSALGVSKTLSRILCEFLKEDGELIEKKRELFQYIE